MPRLYAHPLPEQPREGWRLVPVEITQAMLDATCCDEADDRQMRDAWKALLAAAPTPPSTETKESGE
ncbi:hypothetical protein [Novosphingobium sp. Chol11]|uniref:hypothetical protein n=1 Tax=Novosphingobium sp. Chol11 TaxID=1385763 RepID=UPI00114386E0|nr:hypothetical protein [Novosphingobium sp. Chol11]